MTLRDEPLQTHTIPENFVDTGRCFNGMFRTRNLIEAVLFAALPAYLCINSPLPTEQKAVVTVVVVGLIGFFFLMGTNDESLLEFATHGIMYKRKKRVAKYNPRIKMEAKPQYLTNDAGELPREKVLRLINTLRNRSKAPQEPVSRDIYDPVYQEFFADDLGVVDTPYDLLSRRERRRIVKQQKKEEKHKQKEEKAAAKKQKRTEQRRLKEEARRTNREIKQLKKQAKVSKRKEGEK